MRHHHTIPTSNGAGTMLIMPAWSLSNKGNTYMGVKLVNVYPSNPSKGLPAIQGSYLLYDKLTGSPKAVLDGRMLTLYRTAAASVLAASYLAHPGSRKLLMIGTGHLAPYIVRSYVEVLGIQVVRIWGRNIQKATATADQLKAMHIEAAIEIETDRERGVRWADVISCATMSTTPLVHGEWLKPGQHVDLIGGFTEAMRESDDEAIRRASLFADTRDGVLSEAGDFIQPIKNGILSPKDIQADLEDLTTKKHPGRTSPEAITLFKSVGTALEDLVTAQLAFERANSDL